MRSLIHSFRRDDRGATLVWISAMMVALLGMGALVIDVGALYAERRELQNGADAAALAVAQDCAGGSCLDEVATADTYADENARDEAANVDIVCGSGPGLPVCPTPPAGTNGVSGWVMVTTSTDNPDNTANPDEVDFVLAPVLDAALDGETVDATAVAAWGSIGRATTIPATFSVCEFESLVGQSYEGDFPDVAGYVYFHGEGPSHNCEPGPGNSGLNLPGGFGWLDETPEGSCESEADDNGMVGSDTSPNIPNGCDPVDWRNATVLLPLYDSTTGGGSPGQYHIVGYAGFTILGYKLDNQNQWNLPGNGKCPGTTGNSGRCIYGKFTEFVTSAGQIGGGTPYGASVIQMIG